MSAWQAAILAYLLVSALVVWALCRLFALTADDEPTTSRQRPEAPKQTTS